MAYDFYCSYCGKQLSQNSVLFDMQYLLTQSKERTFNILKFRMTQSELKALIASGQPADNGYRRCSLSFSSVMAYISNRNNLNNSLIAQLTMEEISGYLDQGFASTTAAAQDDDPFGADMDDEMEEEEDLEVQAPYVTPPTIQAIEEKDETNTSREYTKTILRTDFEVLKSLFDQSETIAFEIKDDNDVDNEGKDVLTGYSLHLISGYMDIGARVCPKCGTKVFSHAGTAKHQAVAFIGYQSSGKTSTILALTHYVDNYMINGLSSDIWDGNKVIRSVATVEVLDKSQRLVADLKGYGEGIAPPKTEASKRLDAYSATFRIRNKEQNRDYLLTLTDLPGELCNEDGTIQSENVRNNFPVALSCDAFIACFDTQSINRSGDGMSVNDKVMNVCRWADAFQKMRASDNLVSTYVPTMLLFTKCKELEAGLEPALPKKILQPLPQMYSLKDEKRRIDGNNLYSFVCNQFNQFGQLKKAYHAMMRCSPFGYMAPSAKDVQEGKAQAHLPTPKNIDILMNWLLSVTGCIPTEASFAISPADVPYVLDKFCISRPQLRSQNPGNGRDIGDVEEAMARCALFENPGYFDGKLVAGYNNHWVLKAVRFESLTHSESNDREA